jgi:hypothetical protein
MDAVWEFVEKYYPNYSSSNEIAHNDDLCKLVNGENESGDDSDNLLHREYAGDLSHRQINMDYNESLVSIYTQAILGFTVEQKKLTNP